ncbi:MAG: hypothetical protein KFF50_16395 [Desulfatitalea sp.]|nr:hypothetical protein [Desulfatitalea sp.]
MKKPQGDGVRSAVQWISDERQENPGTPIQKLIDQASTRFNLTPMETATLERTLKDSGQ